MRACLVVSLGALALLTLTADARADREKAAAAYKAASAAFAHGAFTDAATLFETAYTEDPRGPNIYNAALSWQSAHEYARAADDFARAIAFPDLPADLSTNANAQLAKLEPALGKLTIDGPRGARVTIAHADATVPTDVHVKPGHWVVHATYADGTEGDFPVDAVAGTPAHVDVARHPAAAIPPPPIAVEPHATAPLTGAVGQSTLAVGLSLIAVGAVTGGFSIGFGVTALAAYNRYKQSGLAPGTDHNNAVTFRDWANATLVAALVLGAAGIGLVATVHHVKVQVGAGTMLVSATF